MTEKQTDDVIRRTAGSAPHRVYDFAGSPYQIGYQHGRALREEIAAEAAGALAEHARGLGEARVVERTVERYRPVFDLYVPSALEEIRGIDDGSGLGFAYAFFAATRDGMKAPADTSSAVEDGCTAFLCGPEVTADGRLHLRSDRRGDPHRHRQPVRGAVPDLCVELAGLSRA